MTRPLPPPSRPRARTSERVASAPADEAGAPTELSREVEAARADPSRHFGPFLLLSPIGRGGMGVVFRAWNERLRRVVALKTILESEDLPRESVERFRREAEAAARLRHPGIVSVHEAGELSGKHYMAMDFVAGETLERRLAPKDGREKIALTKALEVVRDVARAVEHAHSQGVVHRDLKPANIIIDESGRALVLDFGLASVRGSGTKVTRTGVAMGTPAYMSPEQANG
ncbi:serine/threonine protein kinase, partial [bacterium]|nr:serine/threonine protein kinase [bacterium]